MPISENTSELSAVQQAAPLLTSSAAARLAGVTRHTIEKYIPPSTWYASAGDRKAWPLWTRETILAFRAERAGGAQ